MWSWAGGRNGEGRSATVGLALRASAGGRRLSELRLRGMGSASIGSENPPPTSRVLDSKNTPQRMVWSSRLQPKGADYLSSEFEVWDQPGLDRGTHRPPAVFLTPRTLPNAWRRLSELRLCGMGSASIGSGNRRLTSCVLDSKDTPQTMVLSSRLQPKGADYLSFDCVVWDRPALDRGTDGLGHSPNHGLELKASAEGRRLSEPRLRVQGHSPTQGLELKASAEGHSPNHGLELKASAEGRRLSELRLRGMGSASIGSGNRRLTSCVLESKDTPQTMVLSSSLQLKGADYLSSEFEVWDQPGLDRGTHRPPAVFLTPRTLPNPRSCAEDFGWMMSARSDGPSRSNHRTDADYLSSEFEVWDQPGLDRETHRPPAVFLSPRTLPNPRSSRTDHRTDADYLCSEFEVWDRPGLDRGTHRPPAVFLSPRTLPNPRRRLSELRIRGLGSARGVCDQRGLDRGTHGLPAMFLTPRTLPNPWSCSEDFGWMTPTISAPNLRSGIGQDWIGAPSCLVLKTPAGWRRLSLLRIRGLGSARIGSGHPPPTSRVLESKDTPQPKRDKLGLESSAGLTVFVSPRAHPMYDLELSHLAQGHLLPLPESVAWDRPGLDRGICGSPAASLSPRALLNA
ncbi:hypothetical protein DFP72DRAFT_841393 [Ephemerocybe angulata]|uniref:Uncharacterized protein n=1 Tax=Ephemerocybe angulata TaxID=980116 RepID=A0A8H6MCD1_9AGAR|nr:hypothetical protein DFP72DRAFT_841393 [Tulosesus angulatus]